MGALFGYAVVQASVDNAVTWMQKAARHDWPVLALWIAFWSAFVLISTYYQARARNARPLAPGKPPVGRVVLAPERAAIEQVRDLWSGAGEPTTGDALEMLEQLDRGRANDGLSETQRFAADLRRARQSVANLFAQHDVVTIEEAAGRMENVLWAYVRGAATITDRHKANDAALAAGPIAQTLQRWQQRHQEFLIQVIRLSSRTEFAAFRRPLAGGAILAHASGSRTA